MKSTLFKQMFVASLLLFQFIVPASSQAFAQSAERITNFESQIVLDSSSYAEITETIDYDFGSNQKHGIFRDIPRQYVVTGDQGYILDVTLHTVSRDGSDEPFEMLTDSLDYVRVKIGDANTTISGQHEYVIHYTVGPLAILAEDGNEIVRLDVPGTGWPVPVESVSAKVFFSSGKLQSSTCYEGAVYSTAQTCNRLAGQNTPQFTSSRVLDVGETLTVEVAYDAGTFTKLATLTTLQTPIPTAIPWIMLVIIALIIVIPLLSLVRYVIGYWRYRKRRADEIVIAQYEPPEDMSPAEMGLLLDNSSSGVELSATIINLAVKGYLKIEQTADKKWWRNAKYSLHKLKDADSSIKDFEADILKALFNKGNDIKTTDLIYSTSFQKALREFHKTLKENLTGMGFYKPVNLFRGSLNARMSDEGYTKWAYVEGFREFLKMTEKARMEFFDAPSKKPEQFSQYLPYAIALGVEKEWAKQFENLQLDTSEWYQGRPGTNLNSALLVSSLSSSLNSMSRSAGQSSGTAGSGGGFSGGGFSGGGGGSW